MFCRAARAGGFLLSAQIARDYDHEFAPSYVLMIRGLRSLSQTVQQRALGAVQIEALRVQLLSLNADQGNLSTHLR